MTLLHRCCKVLFKFQLCSFPNIETIRVTGWKQTLTQEKCHCFWPTDVFIPVFKQVQIVIILSPLFCCCTAQLGEQTLH